MMEKVLDVFTGLSPTEPQRIRVKYKGSAVEILISFGELKIPVLRAIDDESIEMRYECKIREQHPYYVVTPNVVDEILGREGILSSADPEHVKMLRKWFKEYGVKVIAEIISEEGFRKVKKRGEKT